jgi:uncharacterized protein
VTDAHDEYVDGDINQLADADDEFDDGNVAGADDDHGDDRRGNERGHNDTEAPISTAVLTHIARALADEPDRVSVETDGRGRRVTLRLNVAQQDMGRVIGRRGRTAQAIRALVAAAGSKEGLTTAVDIVD